jgi:hypothetical protein
MATVHFSTDLMPIFQGTCAMGGATCHGDPSVAAQGFAGGTRQWFGPPLPATNSAATLTTIYNGFVGQISTEDLFMDVVKQGDPTMSYLWYKVNNKQNMFDSNCVRGDFGTCGPQMPSNAALIPQAERDLICAWIVQGAPNN